MNGPVTDHALLRWLERVHKIDIDRLRSILADEVSNAVEMGATKLRKNGFEYRIDPVKRVLMTVVESHVKTKPRLRPIREE